MTAAVLELDHLVVGARTIEEGIAYVRDLLGVDVPRGGQHPLMGTHNCLMRVGESTFLEILSIDPDAPQPRRTRWFALDHAEQQSRLRRGPRLIGWVARTGSIEASLSSSSVDIGQPITASRGNLTWMMGVRDDGRLPEHGLLPVLIQWPLGRSPVTSMMDLGVRLERVRLLHPSPDHLSGLLRQLGAAHLAAVGLGKLRIEAEFRLPGGGVATMN